MVNWLGTMDDSSGAVPEQDPDLAALRRLLAIAETDTGQSRSVANFLLAWWNASACGGFDFCELWGVSDPIRADIVEVIQLIARDRHAASEYGLGQAFEQLVRRWRPHVTQAQR